MRCKRTLLSALRDGPITVDQLRRLRQHLAECPDCRAAGADYDRIGRRLRQLPAVYAPPTLRESIFREIDTDQVRPARRPFRPGLALALPAVAAGLVLSLLMSNLFVREDGLTPDAPAVLLEYPTDRTQDVAVESVIQITFDRPMDRPSVEAALAITPNVVAAVRWNETGTETKLVVVPKPGLQPNTTYTVTLGPQARDVAGNTVSRSVSASWSTHGPPLSAAITAAGAALTPTRTPIAASLGWVSLRPSEAAALAVGDSVVIAADGDGQVSRRSIAGLAEGGGGGTWSTLTQVPAQPVAALVADPADRQVLYAVSPGDYLRKLRPGGLFVSRDGGKSWQLARGGWAYSALADASTGAVLVGADATILRTVDRGRSWQESSLRGLGDFSIRALAQDPREPSVLYAGGTSESGGGLFVSRDGGRAWRSLALDGARIQGIADVAVSPTDGRRLYAVGGDGLLVSSDGGQRWQVVREPLAGLNPTRLRIDPRQPNVLYVATSQGVLASADGGRRWTPLTAGLGRSHVNDLQIALSGGRTLLVAAASTGIWAYLNPALAVGARPPPPALTPSAMMTVTLPVVQPVTATATVTAPITGTPAASRPITVTATPRVPITGTLPALQPITATATITPLAPLKPPASVAPPALTPTPSPAMSPTGTVSATLTPTVSTTVAPTVPVTPTVSTTVAPTVPVTPAVGGQATTASSAEAGRAGVGVGEGRRTAPAHSW